MERIVLEVDDAVARKWKTSSQKLRKQAAQLVEQLIFKEKPINDTKSKSETKEEFIAYFDNLRNKMAERGLTQEKLDEILRNE